LKFWVVDTPDRIDNWPSGFSTTMAAGATGSAEHDQLMCGRTRSTEIRLQNQRQ
jgi:hypothetical protein